MREIAARTGLSIATVSRVLTGKGQVAEETRRRVQAIVDGLGDHAPVPRARAARPALPVFVRCPYQLSDYFGAILTSVAEALALNGRRMLLDAGDSAADSPLLRSLPGARDIAGAILVLPPEPLEELERLQSRRFPVVVVDPRVPVPRGMVSISAAHAAGSRAVTRHLLALGHRRIGLITGPPHWLPRDDRVAGHLASLAEAGLLGSSDLIRHGEPNLATGLTAGGELLDLPESPTAVVCFNDKIAVGVMQAAAARGLRVPDDLSVAGFDDSEMSRATSPHLTTVRQPLEEMGRIAVTMLLRLLEGHALDALHIELATELVIRESTRPPAR